VSTLPLRDNNFVQHKSDFHDALCCALLPRSCMCGVSFSVEHALSYPWRGFFVC